MGDAFTRAGYVPVVAGDPGDVPRLMAEHKPHLALLDLVLPEGDGIGLMYDIQGAADVPIIFLSAYGQDDTVARALEMGAANYLVKPFSPTELAARTRAALRRRLEPLQGESSRPYAVAGLGIDYARRRVTLAREPERAATAGMGSGAGARGLVRHVVKRTGHSWVGNAAYHRLTHSRSKHLLRFPWTCTPWPYRGE